jgi:hypothetical protein
MNEKLRVYAILLKCGLLTLEQYNKYLNVMFLENPESDLLLELQRCSKDLQRTIEMLSLYAENAEMDDNVFGKIFFAELKPLYEKMDLNSFAQKAYAVWNLLPGNIAETEPFVTLVYAGDPLSYGDEKQTREMCEKMFRYYENNDGI